MDMLLDRTAEPRMEDIKRYIEGEAGARWSALTEHIEQAYSSKPQIIFFKLKHARKYWVD